ncbi:MAG: helicase HerA-like domain-containing protein [Pseudomonadota bacterium]
MVRSDPIVIGKGAAQSTLYLPLACHHGLIAGSSGTGKTHSIKVLAEGFSLRGVPVFVADPRGDLAGLSLPGRADPTLRDRATAIGVKDYREQGFPTRFWDLLAEQGHPVRATVSEVGPVVLARMLGLNAAQQSLVHVAFQVADQRGIVLLDLQDLRVLLNFLRDNAAELASSCGHISTASISAIARRLLTLERQGGAQLFGEPALDVGDLLAVDGAGQGTINLLAADRWMIAGKLYAGLMLWLLGELYESMPEVTDQARPKLAFFFDEAQYAFRGASPALVRQIETAIQRLRRRGVAVYLVARSPMEIPKPLRAQLDVHFWHGLRASALRDPGLLGAMGEHWPEITGDVAQILAELAVGEALVSIAKAPGLDRWTDRTMIRPPCSRVGPVSQEERSAVVAASPIAGRYEQRSDRRSARARMRRRVAVRQASSAERGTSPPHNPPEVAKGKDTKRTPRAAVDGLKLPELAGLDSSFSRVDLPISRGTLGAMVR